MKNFTVVVLALILCAGVASARAPQKQTGDTLRVALPGESWALTFDLPGFKVTQNGVQPNGRAYLMAENASALMGLSVYLEKTAGKATVDDCKRTQKERITQKVPYKREKIDTSESGDAQIVEYTVPDAAGVKIEQRSLFACIAKDDVYIDIHVSKAMFKPDEEALLHSTFGIARFVDQGASNSKQGVAGTEPARRSSAQLFAEGSGYYLKQDFAAAICPHQKALDMEKESRQLSTDYWRVLIDNLGMAYGITGDLDHSEQTLNYGLSQDATYPMFYYNLACVAAGRNDMAKTMDLLRKAYSYKANVIKNETMPDPRKDDSFQLFMRNQQFQDFVNSL
jgi:hypothetical protein